MSQESGEERSFTALEKVGLLALGTAIALVVLAVAAPSAAAGTIGGGLVGAGLKLLTTTGVRHREP